jgi:hypothetical protein
MAWGRDVSLEECYKVVISSVEEASDLEGAGKPTELSSS